MQNLYEIRSSETDELTYYFNTRFGIEYTLVLTIVPIGDVNTFSISLYTLSEAPTMDSWIRNTMSKFIADILKKDSNTVLYVCDSDDGREDKRQNAFDRWYTNAPAEYSYIGKYNYSVESKSGYKVNSSLLYNKGNPLISYIITEFKSLMDIL